MNGWAWWAEGRDDSHAVVSELMNEVWRRSLYDLWPTPALPRPAEELYETFSDPDEL